jgi:cation:H+ antiporter
MPSIIIGIVLLYIGAESLVRGSSRLAAQFGIPPLVIGLTVVAFGTSSPELLVSISAALRGASDVAIGNVLGSNIFNIAVILGLTALIRPPRVHIDLIRREIPILIIVSFLGFLLVFIGHVSRLSGILLFVGLCSYCGFSIWAARRHPGAEEFNIPYHSKPHFLSAVLDHFKMLYVLGNMPKAVPVKA